MTSAFQLKGKPCIAAQAEVLMKSHACAGVLIEAEGVSALAHQQQLEGLDESLASQHTFAQLGSQGSVRRLLGGSTRELAAASEDEDESYDDDLDIDEPLTAGRAYPFPSLPTCFLHPRCIASSRRHSLMLQVRKLTRATRFSRPCMRQ